MDVNQPATVARVNYLLIYQLLIRGKSPDARVHFALLDWLPEFSRLFNLSDFSPEQ